MQLVCSCAFVFANGKDAIAVDIHVQVQIEPYPHPQCHSASPARTKEHIWVSSASGSVASQATVSAMNSGEILLRRAFREDGQCESEFPCFYFHCERGYFCRVSLVPMHKSE